MGEETLRRHMARLFAFQILCLSFNVPDSQEVKTVFGDVICRAPLNELYKLEFFRLQNVLFFRTVHVFSLIHREATYSQRPSSLLPHRLNITPCNPTDLLKSATMYYPISQDGQVRAYEELRKKVLAEEAERKEKQRQLRLDMGLPDLDGE